MRGWASDRRYFDSLLEALSPAGRAVALDWRGHGDSDIPQSDFGTAELLVDALDSIQALGSRTVVPVAHSHAGWVAFQLARAMPDKVAAVVLIDWMPLGAPEEFLSGVRRMQQPEHTREVVSALTASWQEGHDVIGLSEVLQSMRAHAEPIWARAAREISAAFADLGSPLAAFSSLDPPIPVLHIYANPSDDAYLAAQQAYADKTSVVFSAPAGERAQSLPDAGGAGRDRDRHHRTYAYERIMKRPSRCSSCERTRHHAGSAVSQIGLRSADEYVAR